MLTILDIFRLIIDYQVDHQNLMIRLLSLGPNGHLGPPEMAIGHQRPTAMGHFYNVKPHLWTNHCLSRLDSF